jgi:hypothetical protein
MQNRTFVTACCANFDDKLAKFGLTDVAAVKMILVQMLQVWYRRYKNFVTVCYSIILGYVGESVPEILLI